MAFQPALDAIYMELPDEALEERIHRAKETLGDRLVILGHHYQRDEVIQFADYTGDSLKLAQSAATRAKAEYIVFCGVHFMAESADILTGPEQVVILPDMDAGCTMADMAPIRRVRRAWEDLHRLDPHARYIPVTYINSTAAIKAFCGCRDGIVCTSSNAGRVFQWAWERGDKIFFLPDEHLGRNTAYRLGVPLEKMAVYDPRIPGGGLDPGILSQARVVLWKGFCSVHQRFRPEHVDRVRRAVPGIRVVVHPECAFEVVQKADEVGSTEFIIRTVAGAEPGSAWAVGTEIHLVERLAKRHPDRTVINLDMYACLCTTMYRITPQRLAWALERLVGGRIVNRVAVPEEERRWARTALDRMLNLG